MLFAAQGKVSENLSHTFAKAAYLNEFRLEAEVQAGSHKKEYQQKGSDGKITVDNSTGDISITY